MIIKVWVAINSISFTATMIRLPFETYMQWFFLNCIILLIFLLLDFDKINIYSYMVNV